MFKKIMVTGAGGYIGSIASYLLLQKGFGVVTVDNYSRGYKDPLKLLQNKFGKDRLHLYQSDLQDDLSPIFTKEKIDAVLHYAAYCIVDESMKNPSKYLSSNIAAAANLLEIMTKHNVKNIVFSSTCAVYGDAQYIPVDEKHPTNPENPYGESKLMVEKIIEWYGKLKGMRYCILRYFNVCGASDDGLVGDSKKPSSLLVQNAVRGALGIEPFYLTCPKVNTPDKTPIRDYINVVDLNEAHLLALKYLAKSGKNEKINLGTGNGNSVMEIVNKVQKITGVTFKINDTTPRQGDYPKTVASVKKAEKVLGWKPKRTIEDSVKSLVKWYKAHPKGWDN